MIDFIDKAEEIRAIKKQFGAGYYHNPETHRALGKMWGISCSKYGGVQITHRETLVEMDIYYRAEFTTAETSKGYWLVGVSGNTSIDGFGYSPSVWTPFGFYSCEDARAYAIAELVDFYRSSAARTDSSTSASHRKKAAEALTTLEAAKIPQLELF